MPTPWPGRWRSGSTILSSSSPPVPAPRWGVSKARDRADLLQALETALQYDKKVLVEEFIDGQEVECAVPGQRYAHGLGLRRD